jgi:ssDNA-binding Zn-finger/Zn-ribbon topoisomerase 1
MKEVDTLKGSTICPKCGNNLSLEQGASVIFTISGWRGNEPICNSPSWEDVNYLDDLNVVCFDCEIYQEL